MTLKRRQQGGTTATLRHSGTFCGRVRPGDGLGWASFDPERQNSAKYLSLVGYSRRYFHANLPPRSLACKKRNSMMNPATYLYLYQDRYLTNTRTHLVRLCPRAKKGAGGGQVKFHLRPKLPRQHFEQYEYVLLKVARGKMGICWSSAGWLHVPGTAGHGAALRTRYFVKKASVLLNILDETAPGNDQLWI